MKSLSVLHICNDYLWTKVHRNLYFNLDQLEISQKVFTPLRGSSNKENNTINFKVENSKFLYSSLLKKHHRFFFRCKIKKMFEDIELTNEINNIDLVHATTLFSDGALAYKIFKKYKKPYVVSIRNTDINIFLKYRPDLIFLAHKILNNAKKIIFISQSNHNQFYENRLIKLNCSGYKNKTIIINNGIDQFWLDNINKKGNKIPQEILFIGRFDNNKNVLAIIKSFLELNKKDDKLKLNLVGGLGENQKEVEDIISKNKDKIRYFGVVTSMDELLGIYRESDIFAMVSHYETFGLVYIEALTQGLPILYTKNQGIDGAFEENVGIGVDSKSEDDIYRGLKYIIDNFDNFQINKIDFGKFHWQYITLKYIEIYNSILR
jgi:glycosyltransferase involved in cell wall biosynthesis